MEELRAYQEVSSMIHKKVNEYFWRYNVERDDLLGQANLIFCESYYFYNQKKEKYCFSTYLYNQLDWKLLEYIGKQINRGKREIALSSGFSSSVPYYDKSQEAIIFRDRINQLDRKCRYILRIICCPNRRERKELNNMTKRDIKNYLRKKGFRYTTIERCFNRIELELLK